MKKPVHCNNCNKLIYWNQNRKTKGIFYTDTPYYDKNEVHRIKNTINHSNTCLSEISFNPKNQDRYNYSKRIFDFDLILLNEEKRKLKNEFKKLIEEFENFEIIQILNLNMNSIKSGFTVSTDNIEGSYIGENYKGVLTDYSKDFLFFNESDFKILKFKGFYLVELDNKKVKPFNTVYTVNVISELTEINILNVFEDFKLKVSEGKEKYGLHKYNERDTYIVKKKKEEILKTFGKLHCEVCEFVFESKYGIHGKNYIECHHLIPFSKLRKEIKTSLKDLILVCSNCHRMIHRKKFEPLSPDELKKILLI